MILSGVVLSASKFIATDAARTFMRTAFTPSSVLKCSSRCLFSSPEPIYRSPSQTSLILPRISCALLHFSKGFLFFNSGIVGKSYFSFSSFLRIASTVAASSSSAAEGEAIAAAKIFHAAAIQFVMLFSSVFFAS